MTSLLILLGKFVVAPLALGLIMWLIAKLESFSPKTQGLIFGAWAFVLGSTGVFIFHAYSPKGTPEQYALNVLGWFLAIWAMWMTQRFIISGIPALGLIAGRLLRRLLRKRDFPVAVASPTEAERHKGAPFLERL